MYSWRYKTKQLDQVIAQATHALNGLNLPKAMGGLGRIDQAALTMLLFRIRVAILAWEKPKKRRVPCPCGLDCGEYVE